MMFGGRPMKKILVLTLTAVIVVGLAVFITIRAIASSGIEYDPNDQGYCETYGIKFDSTQVETIYLHPETILADPEAFLSTDLASLMLANIHTERNKFLDVNHWVQQVERIAILPIDEREQQLPYELATDVIQGKETFCKIAVPHLLSYMPEWAEVRTTIYQTALDPINSGFHNNRGGIVMAVSHPLYLNSEKLLRQGSASIHNIMAHELFHRMYKDAWLWQTENPLENGALRELIRSLQNEGMAVNAAFQLTEYYPNGLSIEYPLHQFQPYIRYWLGRVNKIFEGAESKSMGELYQDILLCPDHCKYVLGGYMAGKIEDELGREVLVETVATGPISFIQTYNEIAEEGMEIHFSEPEDEPVSIYQDLRTSALEGDLARVRKNLEIIQSSTTSQLDIEAEGYLVYTSGYILLKSGHLDLAEEVFQVHIDLLPQVSVAYVGLGDVCVQHGDIPAAIENYERAIEMDARNQWVTVVIRELGYGDE
jgi:tetratricopeptide (TPR) repeat protein